MQLFIGNLFHLSKAMEVALNKPTLKRRKIGKQRASVGAIDAPGVGGINASSGGGIDASGTTGSMSPRGKQCAYF